MATTKYITTTADTEETFSTKQSAVRFGEKTEDVGERQDRRGADHESARPSVRSSGR